MKDKPPQDSKDGPKTNNQLDIKGTLKPIFVTDLKLKLSQNCTNILSDISSQTGAQYIEIKRNFISVNRKNNS